MTWPIQSVSLNVADLETSRAFYQHVIGMRLLSETDTMVALGIPGSAQPLLTLRHVPEGYPSRGGTGLYHFALLLPSRRELAKALYCLAQRRIPLQGLSDHYVSEAIYLADPEGNGIEIYADRPRADWEFQAGTLQMGTTHMDAAGVLAELKGEEPESPLLPSGTIMGHIHLHVVDLAACERFYTELLGLDLMLRYGRMASFLSWAGYHHHIGINTWRQGPVSAVSPQTLGLCRAVLDLGDGYTAAVERLQGGGYPLEMEAEGVVVRDPAQNALLLSA